MRPRHTITGDPAAKVTPLPPVAGPRYGEVVCRHCGLIGRPRRRTSGGAWLLLVAIIVLGIIFLWPLLLIWVPLLIPCQHVCRSCGLRLD